MKLLIRTKNSRLHCCVALVLTLCLLQTTAVKATPFHYDLKINAADTVVPNYGDSLHYPIKDRRGDFFSSGKKSTFDFGNPFKLRDSVVYDPKTRRYIVYEKIGNKYYRSTTSYSFDEYWKIRDKQLETEYFKKRSNLMSILNRGKIKRKIYM